MALKRNDSSIIRNISALKVEYNLKQLESLKSWVQFETILV